VINGQKIWTSNARHADWIHILTRTDIDAPKHRGISYFLVDMHTPGITVRPLVQMHGAAGFTETFYEDARVPASNMVGEEHRGWYVATTLLDFERSGVDRMATTQNAFEPLLALATEPGSAGEGRRIADSDAQRRHLADTAIELEVSRLLSYRVTWMQSSGLVPNYEASISKVHSTELLQRNARRGINAIGLHGALAPDSKHAVLDGCIARSTRTGSQRRCTSRRRSRRAARFVRTSCANSLVGGGVGHVSSPRLATGQTADASPCADERYVD
jgi:alkylation response protein AidB-like acyl-CoA dehydrogenase